MSIPHHRNVTKQELLSYAYSEPGSKTLARYLDVPEETALSLAGMDLEDETLTGICLSGVQLTGANLSEANLDHSDLSHALLNDANLNNASLRDADLRDVDLTKSSLKEAYLVGANLTGAKLTGMDAFMIGLSKAQLTQADLTNANLSQACCQQANFGRANLRSANLYNADLEGSRLFMGTIQDTDCRGADFSNAIWITTESGIPCLDLTSHDSFPSSMKWQHAIMIMPDMSHEISEFLERKGAVCSIKALGRELVKPYLKENIERARTLRQAADMIMKAAGEDKQAIEALAETNPNFEGLNLLGLRIQKFDHDHPTIAKEFGVKAKPRTNAR